MSLTEFTRNILPSRRLSGAEAEGTQYGVIPYRIIDEQVVFLMITSRRSANWVFPKGSPIKGLTPAGTAAQEAWEEAGIKGEIGEEPVGHYVHPQNKDAALFDRVRLFPMRVTAQAESWPEQQERFRHWALLPQTRKLLASRQAGRLAADLHRQLVNQSVSRKSA